MPQLFRSAITTRCRAILFLSILLVLFLNIAAFAETISSVAKYAFGENAGWFNLMPAGYGVTTSGGHLSGYAWQENVGWIKLWADPSGSNSSDTNWGVNRDTAGDLSGYAWSENAGWIDFRPTGGGVAIDSVTGKLDGYAWGENIGWIHFRNAAPFYGVTATPFNPRPDAKYAWSENCAWVNLLPTGGGVTVANDHLSGYAWQENTGWIKLGVDAGGPYANTSAATWGVNRDTAGNLSGYAWSESAGWINLRPTSGGVTIDLATGAFDGYAWGENVGWVHFRSPTGGPAPYLVALAGLLGDRSVLLTLSVAGFGTVTSTPQGIACNTNCSAQFSGNSIITLSPAAAQYSLFSGWAGACANATGDCSLAMDADKGVTAAFYADTAHFVLIDKAPVHYYPSLTDAYLAAVPNDTIKAWGVDFFQNLTVSKTIVLRGGYDSSYATNCGTFTTIHGALTIRQGRLTVENVVVR